MKRRKFLSSAALSAFAVSVLGANLHKDEEDNTIGDCATTKDILGPFYREDAPVRKRLVNKKHQGSTVLVKGRVFGSDCTTPLKDALVEIWYCNTEGEYDNESSEFEHRARWFSNGEGEYEFLTAIPGKYLNGREYRPAHIHFRVRAKGHQELISQIYFKGDPHIESDPWASHPSAEQRVLPIVIEGINGGLTVVFDIYLKK